jgi:hypothetical protein
MQTLNKINLKKGILNYREMQNVLGGADDVVSCKPEEYAASQFLKKKCIDNTDAKKCIYNTSTLELGTCGSYGYISNTSFDCKCKHWSE